MPIRLDTPRQSYRRTELSALEKYRLAIGSTEINSTVMTLMMAAISFNDKGEWRKRKEALRLASICMEMIDVNAQLANLPKTRSLTCGPLKDPSDFDSTTFYEQFRFRREHFWMILQALHWTTATGAPKVLKFGKRRHRYTMRTDHIMMVFLRRMAFPARWPDINQILGGSRSTCSAAYNFALEFMFNNYVPLVQDLHRWKNRFATFAKQLKDIGAPYDNLVSFVDRHFDRTARPMGDGCVNLNVKDFHVYNHLHKDHGLMFQGLVLVNGMAMCWGPFAGSANDANTVIQANIVSDMADISTQLGETFSHFADSAYPQSRYMQCIQKCPAGGKLSQAARRFNALMARFRVVVENLFAEVDTSWSMLQHKQNKFIGRDDVGKMFPCAIVLHNLRTLCYGNQTGAYFGLDGLLDITLSQYLDRDFEFE